MPIRFGVERATRLMAPSLVLPFVLLILCVHVGWLGARGSVATVLGLALALWGLYVAYLIRKRPEELARENHPSWVHMYLMLMSFQVGLAVAYVL